MQGIISDRCGHRNVGTEFFFYKRIRGFRTPLLPKPTFRRLGLNLGGGLGKGNRHITGEHFYIHVYMY
jgi:hypothetical protein